MFDDYSFVHEDKSPLSPSEMLILRKFFCLLSESTMKLVYRGEQRFSCLYGSDDIKEVLYRVFLIGAKGEHFWKQRSKYITKTICKKTFDQLFVEYNKLFSRKNIDSVRTAEHLNRFKETNKDFCGFFLNLQNCKILWDTLKNLNQKERGIVLNYYIAVLHGIGHIALNGSHMISTSTDIDVAKHYQKNGIIYVSWICNYNELVPNYDINKSNQLIRNLNLPICSPSVFPEDYEICITCGLLPHKIIGIIHDDLFYVNPNMFSKERTLDDAIKMGFYIDQTHFDEILKLTKYKRAFDVITNIYGINDVALR